MTSVWGPRPLIVRPGRQPVDNGPGHPQPCGYIGSGPTSGQKNRSCTDVDYSFVDLAISRLACPVKANSRGQGSSHSRKVGVGMTPGSDREVAAPTPKATGLVEHQVGRGRPLTFRKLARVREYPRGD